MSWMRDYCNLSLLSISYIPHESAYQYKTCPLAEFSESLLEMGNCLLERTAFNSDGECGKELISMLFGNHFSLYQKPNAPCWKHVT